jgi:uncharacterized protein
MPSIHLLAERARLVHAGLEGDVPSPCISICKLDSATEFCEGCFRTLDEIAAWSRLDDESKRAVWQLIAERLEEKRAA